jgi:hypothetical protein
MQFSNSSTNQGIVQDAYFGVGANSNSYPIADVTRAINKGLDRVSTLILQADNRWQFDDYNNTTLPIATTNLITNQQDYQFDSSFLEVVKVLIADENGNYYPIYNIDSTDQNVYSYLQNLSANKARPIRYDIIGNSILLDPVPNYSEANGVKVYFKRKAEYFSTSDTTKEPGFAGQFHQILSLYAQYDYATAKNLQKREAIKRDILEMEKEISKFYARRLKDYQPRLIPRYRNPA